MRRCKEEGGPQGFTGCADQAGPYTDAVHGADPQGCFSMSLGRLV